MTRNRQRKNMVCDSESGPISLSLSLLSVYGLLLMSQAANGFLLVQPLGVGHGTSSVSRAALQLSPAASRTSRTPRRYRRGTRRSCLCASASSTPSLSPSSRFDDDGGLIVGLNKYSHDSAICIMRGRDGKVLFGCEKERLTRNKHDGGDAGELVQHALGFLGATLRDVRLVVSNNHHHRVAPFERRIPWSVRMGVHPPSYASPQNLIPDAEAHAELSHHLAHAWSAAELSPFDCGLIVVMDGMGEAYGAMAKAEATLERAARSNEHSNGSDKVEDDSQYYNDLRLMREMDADEQTTAVAAGRGGGEQARFQQVPENFVPHEAYREAESAYTFAPGPGGGPPVLTPVYKRWTRERSPPELYNHGFENMESLGAVYSRVSSHIFGDWNACGKVMGLAPWASQWSSADPPPPSRLTSGHLLAASFNNENVDQRGDNDDDNDSNSGDSFRLHWDAIEGLWRPNDLGDPEVRPYYAGLASTAQRGLEEAAMTFVSGLRERTGENNLCLCGGVALNSVLNGKIAREGGFDRVFVPPCPGDEGIAVGCAAFGYNHLQQLLSTSNTAPVSKPVGGRIPISASEQELEVANANVGDEGQGIAGTAVEERGKEADEEGEQSGAAPPFWGKGWSEEEVEDELEEWEPWVDVRPLEGLEQVAQAIADGRVVAWFQGRGEFGPRALGSRSLLADPRDPQMPARINTYVKKREDFRPFAPSVLAEEANDWFEGLPVDGSPYMSITAPARRGALSKVPAVCHVDGSSRLQTVKRQDNPLYHRLISAFFKLTSVPMVLNTSFNVMGEPIVDSPGDAIRALVDSAGSIDMLVMHDKIITLRPFPPDVEDEAAAIAVGQEPEQKQDEEEEEEEYDDDDDDDDFEDGEDWEEGLRPFQARPFMSEVLERDGGEVVRVRVLPEDGREKWIDLDDEFQLEILLLADGSRTVADIVNETAAAIADDEEEAGGEGEDEEDGGVLEDGGEGRWEREDEETKDAVLAALRVLYAKCLVGFDRMVEAVW